MGNLGDAIPPSAAAPRPMSEDALARKREEARAALLSSSHEFLKLPAVVVANVQPDEKGRVVLPRDHIRNVSSVTAIVVHPSGVTSKTVALPKTEIPTIDLRLQKAFDGEKHLAQKKWSKVLQGGEQHDLGDARTTRIQVYASLADVYRLYSTLLPIANSPNLIASVGGTNSKKKKSEKPTMNWRAMNCTCSCIERIVPSSIPSFDLSWMTSLHRR